MELLGTNVRATKMSTLLFDTLGFEKSEDLLNLGLGIDDETYELIKKNPKEFKALFEDASCAERVIRYFEDHTSDFSPTSVPEANSIPSRVSERRYVVKIYKWPLNIGEIPRKALEGAGKITGKIPSKYYHVGVVFNNTLHHYNASGIQQHIEMPKNYVESKEYHTTTRTRNEFDHWLQSDDISAKYKGKGYKVCRNNCICFAKDLCSFLGVPFEQEQDVNDLQNWLNKNADKVDWLKDMISGDPIMKKFQSSGVKIKSSSTSSGKQMEGVKNAIENVLEAMECIYALSNTGRLYDKDIGAENV